jgi:OmpA-OmpF porin, OOP family
MVVRFLFTIMALTLLPASAHANWLHRAVEGAVERTGTRAVDEAADTAYEGAKDGAKRKAKGSDSHASGETEEKSAPTSASSKKSAGKKTAAEEDSRGDIAGAEQIYSKYDFIPGDRVIFFDDFSDTEIGEYPRKWTLNGPDIHSSNTVEVVSYQGRHFLRSVPPDGDDSQDSARQYIRLKNIKDMPQKFTVEFDAVLGYSDHGRPIKYNLLLVNEDSHTDGHGEGNILISGEEGRSVNTTTRLKKADGKIHRISVSVNGTFVKAYVDGDRVVNDPDGIRRPVTHLGLIMDADNYDPSPNIMFTNFRVAEGGKDVRTALDTDGKIITHGIMFDVNSDRLKPESLPTLKMIMNLLQDDPSLKFSIEGHTDNQGGPAINQPLSEKRAQAVKIWLEGKGIAATRLTAKGWGQEKPMAKNDTPEGRANNRRVEFVKIR